MKSYRTKFPTPDIIKMYIEELQKYGSVKRLDDITTDIVIEAEDEYDLANVVREIESAIGDAIGTSISIPRPKPATND